MPLPTTSLLARHKTTILVCVGAGIILLITSQQWESIESALSGMATPMAALALLLLVCANTVSATLFASLASDKKINGYDRVEITSVFLISQSAKYVPGKIWSVLMQAVYLRDRIAAGKMIAANIEVALLMLGTVSMIGLGVATWVGLSKLFGLLVTVLGILATLLIVMRSPLRRLIFRSLARLRNKGPVPHIHPEADKAHGSMIALYVKLIGFASFYLAGWLVFIGPALDIEIQVALKWVGLMSLSYALGVLSMFPAGVGVREASIYLLATYSGVDPGQAASIAILSRIMMLAIDACGILLGSIFVLTLNAMPDKKQ